MCYNARMKWMLHSFWALPPMLLLGRPPVPAGWLHRREWNMAKLTGRGLEGHAEAFAVQVLPDAVVIRFR